MAFLWLHLRRLRSPHGIVRLKAIRALGRYQDKRVTDVFRDVARWFGLKPRRRYHSNPVTDVLLGAATSDDDPEVRSAAFTELEHRSREFSVQVLVQMIVPSERATSPAKKIKAGELRRWAKRRLIEGRHPEAVGRLAEFLGARDAGLRGDAAEILKAVGWTPRDRVQAAYLAVAAQDWDAAVRLGPAAVPALSELLGHPETAATARAASVLGQIADPAIVEPLLNLSGKESRAGLAARQSLVRRLDVARPVLMDRIQREFHRVRGAILRLRDPGLLIALAATGQATADENRAIRETLKELDGQASDAVERFILDLVCDDRDVLVRRREETLPLLAALLCGSPAPEVAKSSARSRDGWTILQAARDHHFFRAVAVLAVLGGPEPARVAEAALEHELSGNRRRSHIRTLLECLSEAGASDAIEPLARFLALVPGYDGLGIGDEICRTLAGIGPAGLDRFIEFVAATERLSGGILDYVRTEFWKRADADQLVRLLLSRSWTDLEIDEYRPRLVALGRPAVDAILAALDRSDVRGGAGFRQLLLALKDIGDSRCVDAIGRLLERPDLQDLQDGESLRRLLLLVLKGFGDPRYVERLARLLDRPASADREEAVLDVLCSVDGPEAVLAVARHAFNGSEAALAALFGLAYRSRDRAALLRHPFIQDGLLTLIARGDVRAGIAFARSGSEDGLDRLFPLLDDNRACLAALEALVHDDPAPGPARGLPRVADPRFVGPLLRALRIRPADRSAISRLELALNHVETQVEANVLRDVLTLPDEHVAQEWVGEYWSHSRETGDVFHHAKVLSHVYDYRTIKSLARRELVRRGLTFEDGEST